MNKIVGVQSADQDNWITKEEIMELKRKAVEAVSKIEQKPTLEELYSCVDAVWNSGHSDQLIFKNKDQHYAYVTNLYKEQIAPVTLEQYKKMVLTQMTTRLDALESMIDVDKQKRAVELHKEYEKKAVEAVEDLGDKLVELNKKANAEQADKIREVNSALWGKTDDKTGKNN